jgi:CRISPR/Cas system-associated exonuclease Cas4 (RecB family)
MQQNFNRRKQTPRFYFRDILTVLNHQYLKTFYQQKTEDFINYIHRENKIYIAGEDFGDDSFFSLIFRRSDTVDDFTSYLQELFRFLLDTFPAEDPSFKLEKEYIFHIRTRLNKLQNLFEDQSIDLQLESFIRLFRKVLSDFRIPFEGEPLQGVQFMGILESRLLDFENLIFMSMNEGVMPGKGSDFSYVPVNLRYAFGMPVREDKDAIYAYYFYRLLPSAKNIHILYNSQTEGVQTGEPTRYIHQLKYLSNLEIKEYTRSFRVIDRETVEISVEKTDEIMEILRKYLDPEGRKYLSPSALTTYLDCSLRFYFSYVAGINEEDEASEEIDASGFGSLFHKSLELIYSETQGKMLKKEDINNLMESGNIKKHLDQAFREVFLKTEDRFAEVKPEGRNIIIYEIIGKLIHRSLEIDKTVAPFRYIMSEKHLDNHALEIPEGKVHLGGLIDRIDNRDGFVHVIDYKTGKVSPQFASIEDLFDRDSWKDSENLKGIFQTFLYSWLFSKEYPREKYITPSIYQTRELFTKDFTPYLSDKSTKNTVKNFLDYSASFEDELKKLVSSVFNRNLNFIQTEDDKRCKLCPYKEICHRD